MSGGAINYAAAVDSLKQMERRVHVTVSFGVRLPAEAAMAIDFLAEQSETNRNSIVRQALIRYLTLEAEKAAGREGQSGE